MSDALNGIRTKIQWAEKHFSDFKDIAFGRSTGIDTRQTTVIHYQLERKPDPGPSHIAAPSRECRLAFGDAVHQLRSCLDHVVYALIKPRTNDTNVLRSIAFPIFVDETRFQSSQTVKKLRLWLTTDEFAEVERSQPYKRNPTSPGAEWLWILSELDNIDKHRAVIVVDPRLLTLSTTEDGTIRQIKRPLIPGAKGFAVPLPTIRAPDEVNVEDRLVIVVSETGLACDNTTVVHVWRSMIGDVKRTVAKFDRFLSVLQGKASPSP